MDRVDPVQAEVRELVAHLREMACRGARPSEMLHDLHQKDPQADSIFIIRCLRRAFDVRIRDSLIVAGWRGIGGREPDEEVDKVLGRYVAAYREGKSVDWDYDDDDGD